MAVYSGTGSSTAVGTAVGTAVRLYYLHQDRPLLILAASLHINIKQHVRAIVKCVASDLNERATLHSNRVLGCAFPVFCRGRPRPQCVDLIACNSHIAMARVPRPRFGVGTCPQEPYMVY